MGKGGGEEGEGGVRGWKGGGVQLNSERRRLLPVACVEWGTEMEGAKLG